MSQGISISTLARGIIDPNSIDETAQMTFKLTLPTNASEEGHVIWLNNQFREWQKMIRKIPGVLKVSDITVNKFVKKKQGSIEVQITVVGSVSADTGIDGELFNNIMSSLRKTLAEIVLRDYKPDFDYLNPLFEATHHHCYQAIPLGSDWEKMKPSLFELTSKSQYSKLEDLIHECGAILRSFVIEAHDKHLMKIVLRWRLDASQTQRDTLAMVLKAFIAGAGFTIDKWQCHPVEFEEQD